MSLYDLRMELAKPKYRKQKINDAWFNKICMTLESCAINEKILIAMFSSLCNVIDSQQKDLLEYYMICGKIK